MGRPARPLNIGDRFDRLVVASECYHTLSPCAKYKYRVVQCVCDCGVRRVVAGGALLDGLTKSCGCLKREKSRTYCPNQGPTHGDSRTRLYVTWSSMLHRCNNPNAQSWKWYGGKGVRVCRAWRRYENFKPWALRSGYRDDLTIDRIRSNGHYTPSNCRWITRSENTRRAARKK